MWIIEHDGDVFNGKKLWLRPGCKFLFGRTGVDTGGFAIANKTISRKHLTVQISETTPDDAARPTTRSKLILEDLGTKIGTLVNGEQIRGTRCVYENGDKFEIKLAHYEELFRVTWFPCVFTFSFTSKELKLNPMISLCESFGPLDIKLDVNYLEGTTHVVASKRNTSKGLQALINGKYIVDHTYVDAVLAAGTSIDGEPSALEQGFEQNWPDPVRYLPPRAQEPTSRPESAYAPTQDRSEIFDGYTFVFYSRPQFDNLIAPITNGKGKALFRDVDQETTVDDFVGYVKNVAGEKGLGSFDDGSEGRGTVVVRFVPAKGPSIEWYESFIRDVSLRLDHRMIEQGEFLDAILNNDASVLRKPLEIEGTAPQSTFQSRVMAPPATAASNIQQSSTTTTSTVRGDPDPSTHALESSAVETTSSVPARRQGRSRRVITSRFKGFDDFDDLPPPIESSQLSVQEPLASLGDDSQSMFVSQDSNMEVDSERLRSSQKRPASPIFEDSEPEDVMESLAPAAARLKRQRRDEEVAHPERGGSSVSPNDGTVKLEPKTVKTKKKVEIDILGHAREQREKMEAESRAEKEALSTSLDGMTMEDVRKLAPIEEMPLREKPQNPVTGDGSEESGKRWDERWNGRKNFKRFKRRGEEDSGVARRDRVIVPLEEVRRKDFGIGDQYWLEDGSQETLQSRTQSQRGTRGKKKQVVQRLVPESQLIQESQRSTNVEVIRSDDEHQNPNDPDSDLPDIPEFVNRPPSAKVTRATQRTDTPTQSQTSKRAAEEDISRSAATKRAKTASGTQASVKDTTAAKGPARPAPKSGNAGRRTKGQMVEEDEDSDDGLGFKFARRKR